VLRGATVAGMILVNNPGTWKAIYPPLRHADWHGLTPTDVIFPMFLFIVGVAIPFALGARQGRGDSRRAVLLAVVRRSALILGLGLLLHALPFFALATLRIPGVLQRIAVCYLVAALVFLTTRWRTQVAISTALLLGYWALMTLVPVPGFGPGDLGKEGNLAAYLDRAVFGPNHIWRTARVYDPEGILSTLPAIVTTLIGVLAGQWLQRRPASDGYASRNAVAFALAGAVAIALGALWSPWFPVNKALWTSSYVLVTGGIGLIALGVGQWAIEGRGYRRWTWPFVLLGVNALLVYFLSSLMAKLLVLTYVGDQRTQAFLFERVFAPLAAAVNASLIYALSYVVLWFALTWVMARAGLRLRV
jgi:predicted acyltransferase